MKKWMAVLMLVLLLSVMPMAQAATVIQRPDQYFTIMMYRSAAVERMPGTEITSFERDQNDMVYTTSSGAMNGDKVGKTTLFLEEYDSEKDIYYHSRIHVTVEPLDKAIEWERDQSANSAEMKAWVKDNGHVFAVGQRYSVKTACTKDGKSLKVTYSSNRPEVASVDENGMVTMNAPGTANITYQAEGNPGFDCFLIVHDGDAWEHTYGYYEPADPSARLNVYKKADEKSQVIATMGRWESDNFYVFSRGEEWSRVSLNGKIGYVKTAELHFKDQEAENENRDIQVPCTMYVNAQSLGKLDLVSQPNRGSWLGEYATDTPVYVTEITDGFAKVTVDGKSGYMNLTFLSSIKPENVIEDQTQALQGKVMQVYVPGGEALKVWGDKGASITGNQVGSLKNGEVVLMVGKLGDHAEIVYNGKIAYAQKKYLVNPENESESSVSKGVIMHVNAQGEVAVYSEAKAASAIKQKVASGTEVVVYTNLNGWSLVNIGGYTGYIQSQFLLSGSGDAQSSAPSGNMIVQTGNTGKLFLRAKPKAGAAILDKYPNGTYVTLHAKMGEWGHVTVQGKQGYMMLKFLASVPHQQPEEEKKEEAETTPDTGIAQMMVVQTGNTGKLYLRAEPKAGTAILGKYPNGTLITVHEKMGEWGRVTVQGKQGYMMLKFLASVPHQEPDEEKKEEAETTPDTGIAQMMVVQTGNTGKLYLRAEPKAGTAILGKYPNGTLITVHEKMGEWGRVTVEGKQGYMMVKFLADAPSQQPEEEKKEEETKEEEKIPEYVAPKAMVVQTGNSGKLYLRAEPKAGASILDKYPNGTLLVLYETSGEWGRVLIEGKQGYMMLKFLAVAPVRQPEEEKEEEKTEETQPPAEAPEEEPKEEPKEETPEAVQPVKPANAATVTHPKGSFVNLRSGPHTDYRVVEQISHGTQVEVLERGEYWSKIRVNGQEGYMVSNYLK
ncbi:MAG: hypothetical protein E7329_03150 [Clostridiales bacterium]|nr:hypothetical protein [Clostridiales bacterium]